MFLVLLHFGGYLIILIALDRGRTILCKSEDDMNLNTVIYFNKIFHGSQIISTIILGAFEAPPAHLQSG